MLSFQARFGLYICSLCHAEMDAGGMVGICAEMSYSIFKLKNTSQ